MLCKSPVNLTELAYIPLNTGMYLIMTMESQNKTCTTISLGSEVSSEITGKFETALFEGSKVR